MICPPASLAPLLSKCRTCVPFAIGLAYAYATQGLAYANLSHKSFNSRRYERHLAPSQPSMPSPRHVHRPKRPPSKRISWRVHEWFIPYIRAIKTTCWSGSWCISADGENRHCWSMKCLALQHASACYKQIISQIFIGSEYSTPLLHEKNNIFTLPGIFLYEPLFSITVPVRRRQIVPRVNMIPELSTPNHMSRSRCFYLCNQTHTIVYLPNFTYIYHKNQPNVGKYTIHGWCGKYMLVLCDMKPSKNIQKKNTSKKSSFIKNSKHQMHASVSCRGCAFSGVIGIPRVEDWKYVVGFPEPYWWSKPESKTPKGGGSGEWQVASGNHQKTVWLVSLVGAALVLEAPRKSGCFCCFVSSTPLK